MAQQLEDFALHLNAGRDMGTHLENVQAFMNRATLTGEEVPSFVQAMNIVADIGAGSLVVVQSSDFERMARALFDEQNRAVARKDPDPVDLKQVHDPVHPLVPRQA